MPTEDKDAQTRDEALLEEIRRRFDRCVQAEADIRKEGELDMRALSVNGPWDPTELDARRVAKRPCPHHDQLRQHRNKLIGELRLNKRAIEITATGEGANDDTARLRAGRIRQVEYESNATDAYRSAFESMCDRSYGYFKVTTAYKDDQSTDLVACIKAIANPDTVYLDPDAKDYYDPRCEGAARYGFLLDTMPVEDFKAEFPDARITSFGEAQRQIAPAWVKGNDQIQIAEYWRVEEKRRRKLIMEDPADPAGREQYEDELPRGAMIEDGKLTYADGLEIPVRRERMVKHRRIVQYITNGLEILERHEWPGKWIPIIPMLGPEQWSTVEGRSQRMLYSLIRMARSPQMSFDFALANEEEILGLTPKVPWVGYEGQFVNPDAWATAHKVPRAYLEAKATSEATGDQVLPKPERTEFEPPIAAVEAAKQAFAMAIENAIGVPSTEHKDKVAKSGKALEAIDRASDLGTFHFIDNHDRAVQFCGRILEDLLPKIEDTERDVAIREADGKTEKIRLNGIDQNGKRMEYGEGQHEVTVSVGPSYQSERQRVETALETLLKTLPPEISVRMLDLLVKLMNLGPIGDQIVERITPPEFRSEENQQPVPPEVAQKMQEYEAVIQELQGMLQELQFKLEAKTVETEGGLEEARLKTESAEKIAGLKAGSDQRKTETQATTDQEVERIRGEYALEIQAMKEDLERIKLEHARYSQEREIETRPPKGES